jgi:hypothetical protein
MIMQASTNRQRARVEAIGVLDAAASIGNDLGDERICKLALARGDALTQAGRLVEAIAEHKRAVAISSRSPHESRRAGSSRGGARRSPGAGARAFTTKRRACCSARARDRGADFGRIIRVGKTLRSRATRRVTILRRRDRH